MAEYAVLWGGLTIFGIIPGVILLWAYWVGADLQGEDDTDFLGSQDVDQRLKRYKDQ